MRLIEPFGQTKLQERLFVASLLLEVSPAGARRLYDYGGEGRMRALLRIAQIVCAEGLAMPFRLILANLWRP